VHLEELRKLKKCIHLIGTRTRNIPACSIFPQSLRYRVPQIIIIIIILILIIIIIPRYDRIDVCLLIYLSYSSYIYLLPPSFFFVSSYESDVMVKKKPWPESASELYRPSDRRLSAKLVPTFADRKCQVVRVTDPYDRILRFLDQSRYFFFQAALRLYSRG
jgi:hypothetical protein